MRSTRTLRQRHRPRTTNRRDQALAPGGSARSLRHPALPAALLLGGLVLLALLAPYLSPFDPHDLRARSAPGLPPGRPHLLGTDGAGRDVLSQVLYGTHTALAVGIGGAGLAAAIAVTVGIVAGYQGGWTDDLLMRLADVLLALPALPLLLLIASLWRADTLAILIVLALLSWPRLARLTRSTVLSLRQEPFVEAAVACGASPTRIMVRHILPGVLSLAAIDTAGLAARLMLAEASLSFLGLGDPTAITWGKMLAQAQQGHALLLGMWWWIIPPGAAIFCCALGLMLCGLALERALHPAIGKR